MLKRLLGGTEIKTEERPDGFVRIRAVRRGSTSTTTVPASQRAAAVADAKRFVRTI